MGAGHALGGGLGQRLGRHVFRVEVDAPGVRASVVAALAERADEALPLEGAAHGPVDVRLDARLGCTLAVCRAEDAAGQEQVQKLLAVGHKVLQ